MLSNELYARAIARLLYQHGYEAKAKMVGRFYRVSIRGKGWITIYGNGDLNYSKLQANESDIKALVRMVAR